MDLRPLYSDFIMDNRELMFHSSADTTSTFQDDRGFTHCAIPVFQSEDPDLARDPLSTNRRLSETTDLEMFGTMVVAGPTPDQIYILIPDSVGPSMDAESRADLQHVIGLSGNLSSTLPPEGRHLALCDKSLRPTLGLGRQDYWAEVTPILRKWQSMNDASCPFCLLVIWVNMARHLRASHTDCQCFWHCPVSTCPMWFSSELNGKDHLKRIHSFTEGWGYSFYSTI